jgi:phospholipid/cholesterol/gamma-HCH transport system substrate-binding protein
MNREIRLGFFFFAMLLILGVVTLTVSHWTPPWSRAKTEVVYFPSADGLKRGDTIRLLGVPYGRVEAVEYDRAKRRVAVKVSLKRDLRELDLREDYAVTIQESALIGGRYLEIDPGSASAKPRDPTVPLEGKNLPSPMQELSKMVEENRANIRDTIRDLREIARVVREGPGTLHDLLTNRGLYERAEKTVGHLEKFGEKLTSGTGSAAKLLNDPGLYDDLRAVAGDLKEVAGQIRKGPGTIHDLLYDPELGKDLRAAVEDVRGTAAGLREIVEKVRTGEKPLLAYAVDEQTYGKAEQAIQDFGKVVGRAARIEVGLGGGYWYFADNGMDVARLFLRLQPGEDKYFTAGIAVLSLSPHGHVDYKKKLEENDSDSRFAPEVQLAYRLDFLAQMLKPFWLRAGLIEGKPGGAFEAEWKDFSFFDLFGSSVRTDIRLVAEMRDAYNSVEDEKLDENIRGPMIRAYGTFGIWKGFKGYVGVNRIGRKPDLMAGLSFEYTDEDLRSLIAILGLAY